MTTPSLHSAACLLLVLAACAEGAPPSGAASASASGGASASATSSDPVPTPRVKGKNPFAGVKFYINEYSLAAQQVESWSTSRPADSKMIDKIAKQPVGIWMGEWTGDVKPAAYNLGSVANRNGTVPVVVLYNVPNRDCGQYSAGGSKSPDAYIKWVKEFAAGAGANHFIVILEPDALPMITKCLSPADQKARLEMIHSAISILEKTPGVAVYLDAGNSKWVPAPEMAERLKAAGVADADGFALNVSNYIATDQTIAYGKAISAAVGGKHFIVDTGRNGNGATADAQWCNPDGRAVGVPPTTDTGDPLVDAFFWVKPPGESDGTCNGGPKAGEFFGEKALDMIKHAKWAK
jgi:endoglucanase